MSDELQTEKTMTNRDDNYGVLISLIKPLQKNVHVI